MKKRYASITLFAIIFFLSLSLPVAHAEEYPPVRYFYLNACESCNPLDEFKLEFEELTGKPVADFDFAAYNVYHENGRRIYDETTASFSGDQKKLPLLIIGTQVFPGEESIKDGAAVYFSTPAQGNESLIYFLTTTACESCAQVHGLIEELPEVIVVTKDGQTFASALTVLEVNIAQQPKMASALFDYYGIADAQRIAPSVFLAESSYPGAEQIKANLQAALQRGEAIGTPVMEEPDMAADFEAVSLLGAILAGLAAGFNPCALSMLLMFIGLLFSMKRNITLYGTLYLAGKLAAYLSIGLLFSYFWARYAPAWLPFATRVLMTVIGAVLIGMNLSDAIQAYRRQYGMIRNRLPSALRAGLERITRKQVEKAGIWLGAAAFFIGALIAGGEFLCAGQLYAAVLIANAQNPGTAHVLPLIAYCLAFLLPSAVLLFIIALNRRTMEASDWVLRHMPAIKIATAAVFAIILVIMWVL